MLYTQEQIQRANEQSISEYFRRQGYDCKQIRSETHIAGFGGFYVKDTAVPNPFYVHSQQMGGIGLVSCLMKVMNMPFKEAVQAALNGEQGREEQGKPRSDHYQPYKKAEFNMPEKKTEFVMPEKADDNRRVYSYLTKTRYIEPKIVNNLIRSGLLFQDRKGNAVFLHRRDGKPCGAEIHGTSGKSYVIGNTSFKEIPDRKVIPTEPYIAEIIGQEMKNADFGFVGYVYENNANIVTDSRHFGMINNMIAEIKRQDLAHEDIDSVVNSKLKNYKGVAEGTSESFFSYDKGTPQKAYVFESAIDLMSFITLHPEANNCTFAAMAGLKPNVVEKLLESMPVTLCVDNDKAGCDFANRFGARVKVFNECRQNGVKDFNELLKKKKKKTVPFPERISEMKSWADQAIQKAADTPVRWEAAR